jgi:hypothetical protein
MAGMDFSLVGLSVIALSDNEMRATESYPIRLVLTSGADSSAALGGEIDLPGRRNSKCDGG